MGEQTFYFSGGSYLRQLQGLHQALGNGSSVQLLVGREGTGKSALCAKLTQFLRRKQLRVLHFAGGVESPDLLRIALARQLELPAQGNPAALIEEASHASAQPIVLIVDDAHLLSEVTLLEINRLAQVQLHGRPACSVVLSAEPALLVEIQGKSELDELQKAADQPFELRPMTVAELETFMQSFSVAAGVSGLGFTADAMQLLHKFCKGYPGPAGKLAAEVVDSLAGASLTTPLTRHDLDQLIKNSVDGQLLPSFHLGLQSARPGMFPVAAVVVIASLALVYQQLDQQDGMSPTAESSGVENQISPFAEPEPAAPQIAVTDQATPGATNDSAGAANGPDVSNGQPRQLQSALNAAASAPETSQPQPQPVAAEASTELDADRAQLLAAMEQVRKAAQAAAQAATDSDLVLVTAAERGITADQFALPSYEDLLAPTESVAEATVQEQEAPAAVQPETQSIVETDAQSAVLSEVQTEVQTEIQAVEQTAIAAAAPEVDTSQVAAESISDVDAVTDGNGDAARDDNDVETEADTASSDIALATRADNVETLPEEPAGQTAVRSAVDDWLQAWQSQNLEAYFALYHSRFEPRYQDSIAQWRRNRQRVIGNAAWIELELSDYQVIEADAESIEVHFWLGYQSGSYRDRTLKKLVLARENDRWRIIEEVNLEVQA